MRAQVLQHVPFEGPALIGEWLRERGYLVATTRLFAGEPLPTEPVALAVVMGGPMSAHDEADLPWLRAEKAWLRSHLAGGGALVGICLGAQLAATVLGARVFRQAQREIGWWPILWTPEAQELGLPPAQTVCHWHGETYDLPQGARLLASSPACPHQAFAWGGRVLALQFHLEMTPAAIEGMLAGCPEDLAHAGPYVQRESSLREGTGAHGAAAKQSLWKLLDATVAQRLPR